LQLLNWTHGQIQGLAGLMAGVFSEAWARLERIALRFENGAFFRRFLARLCHTSTTYCFLLLHKPIDAKEGRKNRKEGAPVRIFRKPQGF
jgi:hypothetical protein